MKWTPSPIPGVMIGDCDRYEDDRGYFTRTWSAEDMVAAGLSDRVAQWSISHSIEIGTLRGMHYQTGEYAETKLVRCTHGAIWDVALDLRPESPTYCKWFGIELTQQNARSLYIPIGIAHGFQTLENDTEVLYGISPAFTPGQGHGVRWNDPAFGIQWPLPVTKIANRDAGYPDFYFGK